MPKGETLAKMIETLSELHDQWIMAEHRLAMNVRRIEDDIIAVVGLLESINRTDEQYRMSIAADANNYDPEHDPRMDELVRRWLVPARKLLEMVKEAHGGGYVVDNADSLRTAIEDAEGSLMSDAEFFKGGRLAELESQAIEDVERGDFKEGLID